MRALSTDSPCDETEAPLVSFRRPCRGGRLVARSIPRVPLRCTRGYWPSPLRGECSGAPR